MKSWQKKYLDRFYPASAGWKNGTEEFHDLCRSVIGSGSKILEIGPGPNNGTSRFLATLGELHGLDPDPEISHNEALTSASVLVGDRFPFDDASFDACVSDYVLEHVRNPLAQLAEVARVLRPGGIYVFRTPNRWHYVSLVAALTPHWFHGLVVHRLRGRSAEERHDPYPTFFRLNSRGAVAQFAPVAGLQIESLRLVEKEPSYGMAGRGFFLAFMAYERAVNSSDRLAPFRANLFAVLKKPAAGSSAHGG